MLPPAQTLLAPDAEIRPAWARFDAHWYLGRYKEAHKYCNGDPGAALAYYLDIGEQIGHSPSPLFDEAYYLEHNQDVHELIRGGAYRSGFDHFCQHGHRLLSPHWLFDDALYGRLHDDMSLDNLDQHEFYGRYDHYLRSGQYERRTAHYIFDAAHYRLQAIEAGAAPLEIEAAGPYIHYLYSLRPGVPERRPSAYFEPAWYLENAIGAAAAISAGDYGSALEHFLRNPSPELFDPAPQFSEAYYRAHYRDVAHAIENAEYRNGYQHFVQFGAYELRRPHPEIDLIHYRDANPRVREDLRAGIVRDAFAHLRLIGLREGFATAAPDALPLITEPVARQLFLRKARNLVLSLARRRIDFTTAAPEMSVIMVACNQFDLTMLALASLRDNDSRGIELIIVDNGSTDETVRIADFVTGAKIIRLAQNIGYLRAANRALDSVTTPVLLYLNNDLELGHGAIAAARARLTSDKGIGAVCGKILRSHGALQEAGCIIWRDGTTSGYLRDAPAAAPGANFVRDVGFGSGVFLLCRAPLIKNLGGFDEDFSPSYYEDADLCLRIAAAGYRIVYDPSVVVHHLEYGSARNSEAAMAQMRRGQAIFSAKHADILQALPAPDPSQTIHARITGPRRRKILFIEDTVPLRRLGSGFVRANDIVRALAAHGDVSVFPVNGAPYDMVGMIGDFPETVEILHDLNIALLENFLLERKDFYDLIWLSRTHNAVRIAPALAAAGLAETIPIVLDTEAIVAVRDAAHALIADPPQTFDLNEALRTEFVDTRMCRHITAVNQVELDLLKSLGQTSVSLVGTTRAPALTAPDFAARNGLLFVGAIHRPDSPNLDSLIRYAEAILPALMQEMDDVPILHVAGYVAPEIDLSSFAGHKQIKLHGAVGNLSPLYESSRVFIAPTRFAAGTPYKIYEAASYGLPCVTTDLLARQLGWRPGTDLLTAPVNDARRFAAQIAMLYRTPTIWTKLRGQAAARLAAENNEAMFEQAVGDALAAAMRASSPE
jgi:GT2 family glycosyltransferase/glycosyltransferase involved in cell wall biosynthesis